MSIGQDVLISRTAQHSHDALTRALEGQLLHILVPPILLYTGALREPKKTLNGTALGQVGRALFGSMTMRFVKPYNRLTECLLFQRHLRFN